MADLIETPMVQNLGMQGEWLHIKVDFPIYHLETDPLPAVTGQIRELVGSRSIILKMRAEDLPTTSVHGDTLHVNIGSDIRARFEKG